MILFIYWILKMTHIHFSSYTLFFKQQSTNTREQFLLQSKLPRWKQKLKLLAFLLILLLNISLVLFHSLK